MKITSPAFKNNEQMPGKYTCDGENISPPLEFLEVGQNAKSITLIVDDPDAPGGNFDHWVVYNIDPKTKILSENSVPNGGILGMTDFGRPGWGGPCPPASQRGEPAGTHRYFFKLYALDTIFNLAQNADKRTIEKEMEGHVLDKAEIVGLYGRKPA